jgi:hypothetical protein
MWRGHIESVTRLGDDLEVVLARNSLQPIDARRNN